MLFNLFRFLMNVIQCRNLTLVSKIKAFWEWKLLTRKYPKCYLICQLFFCSHYHSRKAANRRRVSKRNDICLGSFSKKKRYHIIQLSTIRRFEQPFLFYTHQDNVSRNILPATVNSFVVQSDEKMVNRMDAFNISWKKLHYESKSCCWEAKSLASQPY